VDTDERSGGNEEVFFDVVADVVEVDYFGIGAGSKTLNSASPVFSAGDVGKTVVVRNAGPGLQPLITTIASYTNATRVVLTDAAGTARDGTSGYFGTNNAVPAIIAGQTLVLPAGKWLTTALPALVSNSAWRGLGPESCIFWAGSTHAIQGHDIWHLRLSDFRIIGPARGLHRPDLGDAVYPQLMDAIHFTKTGTGPSNAATFYLDLERIVIEKFSRDGISIDTPIVTNIRECVVYKTGRHGIYTYGTGEAAGTSTHFDACFAAGCYEAGFYIKQMAYCTVTSCAADACGIGYWYNNTLGLTENSSGTEEPYAFFTTGHVANPEVLGYSRRMINAKITQNAPYMIMNIGVSQRVTDFSRVVINSYYEGSPGNADSPVNDPTYSLQVEDGCFVTLNESHILTPMDLAPGTTVITRDAATTGYVDSRIWTGTQAEYDGLGTYDPTVLYVVI